MPRLASALFLVRVPPFRRACRPRPPDWPPTHSGFSLTPFDPVRVARARTDFLAAAAAAVGGGGGGVCTGQRGDPAAGSRERVIGAVAALSGRGAFPHGSEADLTKREADYHRG